MAKIIGRGAPTADTFGILGQEYIDELTGTRYVCTKSAHKTGTRVGEADHHCEWVEEGGDFKDLILRSSTGGSTKKFRLTVDDDGYVYAIRVYDYTEEIPVASSFDNTGDGIPEVYVFSRALHTCFSSEGAIQIDAVKDVTDNNGVHQEAGIHYIKYDEVAAGIGTLPPHVYCYDNSDNYLRYSFNVEEEGIYELAAHLRIKDEQLRGATYIINKGTEHEHSFVTTYGWYSEAEAFAVRNDDELRGSYMRGMLVYLHAGINTIHITSAEGVTKNQHFRNLYLVKIADVCEHNLDANYTCQLCNTYFGLEMDDAEAIGVGLAEGAIMPMYLYTNVTFNNGAPRASDGFCRVITSNGHLMSIQKITLADGQSMPVEYDTVTLRGKIGCVNSTVNGGIGKEARIFNATIVNVIESNTESEGLAFTLKDDGTYEVSGIGECTDTDIVIPAEVDGIAVTSIGVMAFHQNTSLTRVVIPDSVTSIGGYAFGSCTSLAKVILGNSVTFAGGSEFIYCTSLTSIVLPSSVTEIGEMTFSNCSKLRSITFEGTVAQWNDISFINGYNNGWNDDVPARYVQCSDGQVEL